MGKSTISTAMASIAIPQHGPRYRVEAHRIQANGERQCQAALPLGSSAQSLVPRAQA